MVFTDVQIAFVRKPSWLSSTAKPVNHFSAVHANFAVIEYIKKNKLATTRIDTRCQKRKILYTHTQYFTFNIRFCFKRRYDAVIIGQARTIFGRVIFLFLDK